MSDLRIIANMAQHIPSTKEGCERKAREIVSDMEPWWRETNNKRKKNKHDKRTENEKIFDSGIYAASEFVRRFCGHDERIALAMHELTFWTREERENEKRQP